MRKRGRRSRMIRLLLLLTLLFGLAEVRLAWVQLGRFPAAAPGSGIPEAAFAQRSDSLTVDPGRGAFLDRKGRPLTNEPVRTLAAFPLNGMPRGPEQAVRQAAESIGASTGQLEEWLRTLRSPDVWRPPGTRRALALTPEQQSRIRAAALLGVYVLPYSNRYPSAIEPLHAIGYVSQDPERLSRLYADRLAQQRMKRSDPIGGSGLERSLDRFIRGAGPTRVSQVTDAGRRPLNGLGLRTESPANPHYPLRVVTTLDLDIQREVLETLKAAGVKEGAAVVLDAANADVLAMASLPGFDPERIGAPGTDERNRAITAYAPGSVFKTVTLAAALESGTADLDTEFRCDGAYGRYGLQCWKPEGHGVLTLEEAFEESCNVAFAEVAEKLDPAWIQITAERLGLGRQVGWSAARFLDGKPLRLLGEEEAGAVFADKKTARDGGVRTGTGIGQRDVRVTPLQAANLVVTLLHGGRVSAPRVVSEIRYADGGLAAKLEPQLSPSKYGVIRPETASAVLKAMRGVVTDGTARRALSSAAWPLAGKSGTAEQEGESRGRNDHWFVGYGPAKGKPRYAVAVLIRDQPAGLRNRAGAAFGQIMERLRLRELRSRQAAAAVPAAKPRIPRGAGGSSA
ncbi:peptidoglycan D,D-transpeptidase FtsI family protein [Cohnella caldifontis]|uniref:peptidoglycan D,D-transpeptidase FtsI family protein n=1 Tax=Cohnella caldifontis TaxID=3027471 RepID=UPI0023ECBCE4|nr:penicillin-binding protein 2 [Cohnella sp. YIM B05605]